MDLMGQLGDLLQQYSGAQGGAPPADVEQHYDQVAQGSSPASMAEGLLAAFQDTQHTPAFGNQAAQLFGIHDKTRLRIWFSFNSDVQIIVVTMPIFIGAFTENGKILFFAPFAHPELVRRIEAFYAG